MRRHTLVDAERLAAHWLKPFQQTGIKTKMLVAGKHSSKLAEEHLCLLVQIVRNRIFVVGERNSRLLDMQLHRCNAAGIVGDENENFCIPEADRGSRRGDGTSGCRYQVRPWERHRLNTLLRMLHVAASRPAGLPDCELRLCGDDTCHGVWESPPRPRPLFTMASCLDSPTLPLPQWDMRWTRCGSTPPCTLPRAAGDVDLAIWDAALQARANRSLGMLDRASWQCRESVAAFRGAANQLHTYNNRWGAEGRVRRSKITAANWNVSGRWGLVQLKLKAPALLNVRLSVLRRSRYIFEEKRRAEQHKKLVAAVSTDLPQAASLDAQANRFKYLLHVEGHGGWAERLKLLMLSGATVMKQDSGVREWFEPLMNAGEHYLPVASDLSNLTEVIASARKHDGRARAIALRSVEWARRSLTTTMILEYAVALFTGYAKLFRSPPLRIRPDAVRFVCWPASVNATNPGCSDHAYVGHQLTECGFVDEADVDVGVAGEQFASSSKGSGRRKAHKGAAAGAHAPPTVFDSIRAALLHRYRSSPRHQEIAGWRGTNSSKGWYAADHLVGRSPEARVPCVIPASWQSTS